MKQIIVLLATIGLGLFIAAFVDGDDHNTVKSALGNMWQYEISRQNTYP